MKLIAAFGAAVVAAALGGLVPAFGQSWSGDANFLLAGKRLDTGDWGPVDRQGELGVQTDFQRGDWPVSIAADFLASSRNADVSSGGFNTERGRTTEIDMGVRKIWRPNPYFRPYVGGGVAIVSSELDFSGPAGTVSDQDTGAGPWVGGGVAWVLNDVFNIGLDTKVSEAGVRLFGSDKNAGGFHLGLLLGYHWGG